MMNHRFLMCVLLMAAAMLSACTTEEDGGDAMADTSGASDTSGSTDTSGVSDTSGSADTSGTSGATSDAEADVPDACPPAQRPESTCAPNDNACEFVCEEKLGANGCPFFDCHAEIIDPDLTDVSDASDTTDTGLPDGQCFVDSDCTGDEGVYCTYTDADRTCGICFDEATACASDSDCTGNEAGERCDERPMCLCSPGPVCVPDCASDSDCSRDEVCSESGHCAPQACTADSDCPSTFACDAESGACGRKTCAASSDCASGDVCVLGRCEEEPGVCGFPVP